MDENIAFAAPNQKIFLLFQYQFTQTLSSLTIEFFARNYGSFQLMVRNICFYYIEEHFLIEPNLKISSSLALIVAINNRHPAKIIYKIP